MSDIRVTIYLNTSINDWKGLYNFLINYLGDLDSEVTHVGIDSKLFSTKKLVSFNRNKKKVETATNNENVIENIEIYSLPKDFSQAIFDYNTFICIEKDVLTMSTLPSIYQSIDIKRLLGELRNFIDYKGGEVFEMSIDECPYMYVKKVNPDSDFETLKIIKKI